MIERFNFYDVYGYLLPGLALLGLLFLPLALIGRPLPDIEWSSAVVTVVGGYFAGHVLQILVRRGLPEYNQQHLRLLDPNDTTFPAAYRAAFARRIRYEFDIDIAAAGERQLAFDMCRAAIQTKDTPSYAEQFQGLYALMRGLAGACLLGFANCLGWTISAFVALAYRWIVPAIGLTVEALALFAVILLIAVRETDPDRSTRYMRIALALVTTLSVTAGIATAFQFGVSRLAWQRVASTVIPLLILTLLFHRSYRAFAYVFARTVIERYMTRRDRP